MIHILGNSAIPNCASHLHTNPLKFPALITFELFNFVFDTVSFSKSFTCDV
jgi:hypothetical protein